MTIFLQVAKIILARRIKQIRNDSVTADSGLPNRVITFCSFGFFGRDKELSSTKQDLDDALLSQLDVVQDGVNDKATLESLKQLINSCKDSAGEASRTKGYDEGTSGPAMQTVITLLDDIYKKLDTTEKEGGVKLLDVVGNGTPLSVYRYLTTRYLAQKIEDASNQSLLEKLIQNPQISSCHQLAEEKEKLLKANLKECEQEIAKLEHFEELDRREEQRQKEALEKKAILEQHDEEDVEEAPKKPSDIELVKKNPVDYAAARKKCVLLHLKTLTEQNESLCARFGPKISIPISLAFFSTLSISLPTFRPGPGYLQECIESAIGKISPPEIVVQTIYSM